MPDISIRPVAEHAAQLADTILEAVDVATSENRKYLLGCPTGRTPTPLYKAMAERLARHPQSLRALVLVMMDEYVEQAPDGNFTYIDAEAHNSCRRFARDDIQRRLNASLPASMQLPDANVWFPGPHNPAAYDERISHAGGLGFFILASGASDGHVAFNPPGTAAESRTRIVPLAEQTRIDNMGTFPGFASLDEVPTHGISVGIATIAEARSAAMLLFGAQKAEAFRQITGVSDYRSEWPATVIHLVRNGRILADEAAAQVDAS
ncbi:glucosamine-6-phosphate deaminase [Devosia pacifica]|uniref:Glucosamine-6-phosphate deaminase n=1 Tax=Devosia pacifica TaxID=1335967 RepID=A0A918VXY9_9HYPH|nr:6-phosphogluconolactonase [Devosia pacifica]GHA35777.1 glucosamine-6-phosphate deaminase [Devosia pacifica]